jgi:hypothetical protein
MYQVRPLPLKRGQQVVGYCVFVVADDGKILAYAIQEDEARNRLTHAHQWPATPEAAMAVYQEAAERDSSDTRPYASLVRSVPLPAEADS